MKLTKRKGFNFFRSYYDVFNELEKDEDKLLFIKCLLDKQFLGKNPENLTGIVKFAWISQINSIDSQVKGFEDKTGIKLNPTEPPTQGGVLRGKITPTEQVEEKEKDINIIKELYNKFVDECKNGYWDEQIGLLYSNLKITKGSLTPLLKEWHETIVQFEKRKHKSTGDLLNNFRYWLIKQNNSQNLDKYKI